VPPAFCGQTQREQAAGVFGAGLHLGEDDAGFDGDGVVVRVDVTHPVQAPQTQHGLRAARIRCGAAGEPGIAALRHQRDAVFDRQLHERGDFGGRRRTQHRAGRAGVATTPVGEVGGGVVGIGEDVRRADGVTAGGEEGGACV
jgi:hypothetical protein